MKAQPGTYALVLASTEAAPIRIGKLGRLQIQPGFYIYVGSAHGPGGLRARLAHHLEPTTHPHWHVDYLRANTNPQEVWYAYGRNRWECRWAFCLAKLRGASVPLDGFGSSDCDCGSHLFFLKSRPAKAAFARWLRMFDRDHPAVQVCRLKRIIQERLPPSLSTAIMFFTDPIRLRLCAEYCHLRLYSVEETGEGIQSEGRIPASHQ
jgi:Uri superfamily endonuclease